MTPRPGITLLALAVVGLWIPLAATVPQVLGAMLSRGLGIEDRALAHLVKVALNAVAVLTLLVVTRRTALLRWARPRSPLTLLLPVPLIALNCCRGPLATDARFLLITLASCCCTGFWEEFLFRGLVQERLRDLGHRASILLTAVLFGSIHIYDPLKTWYAVVIGLLFCLLRDRVGLWPLVAIHALIDLASDWFRLEWSGYFVTAQWLIAAYAVAGAIWLLRARPSR